MLEGIFMLTILLFLLLVIFAWNSMHANKRGWKVKKIGNGKQQYLELDEAKKWRGIIFDCEMYSDEVPRHALIIKKDWSEYPQWAQGRKTEIITRITCVLKAPSYTIVEKE